MSHFRRFLRRSSVGLLWTLCGVCAAQGNGVQGELTASLILPGPLGIHAITGMVGAKAAVGGAAGRVSFTGASGGQIIFNGASKVVGALGDFDGDGVMDYAVAFSPGMSGGNNLCVYFGDGAGGFSGGDGFPPTGGKSGCASFAVLGSSAPEFSFMMAAPFKTGELPGLIVEDSANGNIYVLSVSGAGFGGGLPGLAVRSTIAIPAEDGAGPIYLGDFNGDGKTDFIVNGQDGHSASVYFGNGDGTFETAVRYTFDHGARWLRLGDMDGDGHADMVVEGEDGWVEIFHGNADGSFATASEGRIEPLNGGVGGATGGALLVADFDGDGCGDVAVLHSSGAGDAGADGASELSVWYGRCDGTFGEPQVVPLSRNYLLAAVADVDGDGRPDVALSDGAAVSVLYGLGKRSFSAGEQVYDSAGAGVTSLAVADVDRDGAADLVVTNGVAMIAGSGAAGVSAGAGTGGTRVLLNTAKSRAKPEATATTTTTLYLCVGPTVACPSAGYVMPPFSATLSMIYGQTYNGTVIAAPSDGVALTGDILFYDDYDGVTTLLCTLVASTSSSCPPTVGTGPQVGTHVFTGVYVPGTVDTTHSGSTSGPVTLTVTQDTTVATVVGAPNPSPFGQAVTLTATVSGMDAPSPGFTGLYAPPSGTVTFLDGGTVIGHGTLAASASEVSSTATLVTTTLPVGVDPITVTYGGDLDFSGSTVSAVFPETITPVFATTTTLTSSLNPSYAGQSVTFTATVTDVGGATAPVPTGAVTFYDGGAAIGTGTLNAVGVATFTTSTLAVGSHNMTASASGDGVTGPSSSAVLVQVVDALPPPGTVNFMIMVTPNPVSIGVGEGTEFLVTVTTLSGFLDGVNLSCGPLPTEVACQFVGAAIPAGGGSATLILTTTAPHSCGTTTPYFLGGNGGGAGLAPLAAPVLAGLIAVFIPGRRRWLRGLMAMAAVAVAMQLSGCGNCTDLGTRPGTYTVQVVGTATGSGTSEVEKAIVTMTVTI